MPLMSVSVMQAGSCVVDKLGDAINIINYIVSCASSLDQ